MRRCRDSRGDETSWCRAKLEEPRRARAVARFRRSDDVVSWRSDDAVPLRVSLLRRRCEDADETVSCWTNVSYDRGGTSFVTGWGCDEAAAVEDGW